MNLQVPVWVWRTDPLDPLTVGLQHDANLLDEPPRGLTSRHTRGLCLFTRQLILMRFWQTSSDDRSTQRKSRADKVQRSPGVS